MLPVNFNCDTSSSVYWSWRSSLLYARMNEFVRKKVHAFCPINFVDLKVIPALNIKRDRVHALMHDDVYLEVYI